MGLKLFHFVDGKVIGAFAETSREKRRKENEFVSKQMANHLNSTSWSWRHDKPQLLRACVCVSTSSFYLGNFSSLFRKSRTQNFPVIYDTTQTRSPSLTLPVSYRESPPHKTFKIQGLNCKNYCCCCCCCLAFFLVGYSTENGRFIDKTFHN